MWLARDENGTLYLHIDLEPRKASDLGFSFDPGEDYWFSSEYFWLPETMYREVTWENSPIELIPRPK